MNISKSARIDQLLADADDWGPDGRLGGDEAHAVAAPKDTTQAVDEDLGLQMISIRLQRSLLCDLKAIAEHHKIGYQPMIRDLLNRFAKSEIRTILSLRLEELERSEENPSPSTAPVEEFLRKRA